MAKGMKLLFIIMIISLGIAFLWNTYPFIKDTAHLILDPSAGALMDWNIQIGFIILVFVISLITTIVNYFTMDHDLMRDIKKEQKLLQEQMQKFKDNPEKLIELQKKQLEFIPRTMDVTMRPALYTFIPMILLFRWFGDYFVANPVKVLGLSWIWTYLILAIVFSMILRKVFKLP